MLDKRKAPARVAEKGADTVQRGLDDLNVRLQALGQQLSVEARSIEDVLHSVEQESRGAQRNAEARKKQKALRKEAEKKAKRVRAERWEVACSFYDDLALLHSRLAALSEQVAADYVSELLESRAFEDRQEVACQHETNFLDALCDGRAELASYIRDILDRKAWDAVRAIVGYMDVLGTGVDLSRLASRIESDFALEVLAWEPDLLVEGELLVDAGFIQGVSAPVGQGLGTLGELRRSPLGRLYVQRLKHYPPVRAAAIWLWQRGYPIYANRVAPLVFRREAERWRALRCITDYANRPAAGSKFVLAEPTHVDTPVPLAFPEKSRVALVSPHDSYVFPEIFVTTVSKASVYGGTNLVLLGDEVIHHNLYDFERDYSSEELHGRTSIDPKSLRVRWLVHDKEAEELDVAAAFVDACAPNYAHWLTEVLSRIVVFCNDERFVGVPLIVNDGLHRNLMESLRLVTRGERRIVTLPIGRAIKVEKLYLTSNAGYVPFERRTNRLSGHSHGRFSPAALGMMRQVLTGAAAAFPSPKWPEKVYLRRNSGMRKVVNANEIEHALVARGFVVIEPEKLSFLQQVQLFSGVKAVVASTGAAVANIVFCPPETRISIFIARYPDTSYWYWQNIAAASGNVVRYVLGEADAASTQGIHSDFRVSVADVLNAL